MLISACGIRWIQVCCFCLLSHSFTSRFYKEIDTTLCVYSTNYESRSINKLENGIIVSFWKCEKSKIYICKEFNLGHYWIFYENDIVGTSVDLRTQSVQYFDQQFQVSFHNFPNVKQHCELREKWTRCQILWMEIQLPHGKGLSSPLHWKFTGVSV